VEQNLRERRFNALFDQQFRELRDQINDLVQERDTASQERDVRPNITILDYNELLNAQVDLRQERDNSQTELEGERRERAESRERRQQEFNDRLASDRETLGQHVDDEQVARIVQQQESDWRNRR